MTTIQLRSHLAYIRALILMHCRVIDYLKRLERQYLAAIADADGSTRSPGEVAAAVAKAGEGMWQWDGRMN